MAVLKSFELNGNKQSFANWISNLSPCDTPFSSMIGKEGITQSQYSWQVDTLAPADNATYEEGSEVEFRKPRDTHVATNFTSILRKVVQVSETAEKVSTHGRASELAYQMKKAGKEMMRDLEMMNLHHIHGNPGSSTLASKFYGFEGMCPDINGEDVDTGAVTHKAIEVLNVKGPWFKPSDIFDITYNLFLSGSKADKIMYHPRHAVTFASMVNSNTEEPNTYRMFDNLDATLNTQVKKIRDPLGRTYTLIPNRHMPEDKVFFFTESDWTQMVLRSPKASKLSKSGSSERFMIEMEVGLRHRHPYASGILTMYPTTITVEFQEIEPKLTVGINEQSPVTIVAKDNGIPMGGADVEWTSSDESVFTISKGDATTNPTTGVAHTFLIPKKVGTSRLTVTVDGIPLEYIMEVGLPTVSVALAPSEVDISESTTATATVQKSYGALAGANVKVSWVATPSSSVELTSITSTTSDKSQATNTIKGLKEGVVEVVAKVGAVSSRPVGLNIVKPAHTVSISANPNPYNSGDEVTLTATVVRKGVAVAGKTVSWEFPDVEPANKPSNAITDASGVATSSFTIDGNSMYEVKAVCEGIESAVLEIKHV